MLPVRSERTCATDSNFLVYVTVSYIITNEEAKRVS